MHNLSPAETHTSSVLKSLLNSITPEAQAQTDKRMLQADALYTAIQARGWSVQEFAKQIGQKPEQIEKWLSGTYQVPQAILQKLSLHLNIFLPD